MGGLGDPVEERLEVGAGGGGHRDQQVQRPPAHGGDVAHVGDHRLPAQVVEADLGQIGVHACDHAVGGQQEGALGGLDHGGVVADVGEPGPQALDEGELAGQGRPPISWLFRP